MPPVPKRKDQKAGHRTKAELRSIDTTVVEGKVEIPEPEDYWHPIAKNWYESLARSGQSKYYEPSDWQVAHYIAEAMHRNLDNNRFSAQLFASIMSGMTSLLVTEGDRRRMRLEIERVDAEEEADAAVVAIEDYVRELGG